MSLGSSPLSYFDSSFGHYPWAIAFSRTQARMASSGFGETGGAVTLMRYKKPGDPVYDPNQNIGINQTIYVAGAYVYRKGTVTGQSFAFSQAHAEFPWNSRPSFMTLRGTRGGGNLGSWPGSPERNTFDDLMVAFPSTTPGDAGDVALADYIRAGMGGVVPRPEITGNDMRDLIYFIRRSTIAGSYPVPVAPGPDHPDKVLPVISSVSATRIDATTIHATWTTDKPCIGFVACGTPSQQNFEPPYNVFSDIEPGYSTSHSMTVTGCSTSMPTHFSVCAKDVAGNCVHSSDQTVDAASALSPDGSTINGLAGGGGTGTLTTAYGVWSLGSEYAPAAPFGGGAFNEVLLNGRPVALASLHRCAQLRVDFGGRLFGVSFDQIWWEWSYYHWQGNSGADFASGPKATPVLGGPPSYNPPYTPSPENTSISGGVGTLTTVDGVWTWGTAHDGGFNPVLNGIPLGGPTFYAVDQMVVYGHGQMFLHFVPSPWYCWTGRQFNPSTGPTASPVPVNITFSPTANPLVPASSPLGTLVATITVTMSDGSPFSGTLAIDTGSSVTISGMTLVTNVTPFIDAGQLGVTAMQGGVTYASSINIFAA